MKIRELAIASLIGLAALPGVALAGADSGFYIGGGIGQSTADTDLPGGGDFDGDDFAWKAIVGYNVGIIPFLDLAIEGGYVNLGEPDDGNIKIEVDGWDAFAVAGVNLGPIGVFGKVGMINWDTEVNGGSLGDDDGTDPAYGLGVRFQLASFQIRAEAEMFDVDDVDDVYLLSASALYTF
jgi:hypothetical protein